MDTPEFGEVTKQKIGYRLREVLSGKKGKVKGKDDVRVYDFNAEKLRRIAKKYGCSLADKWTGETSCEDVLTLKTQKENENTIKEEHKVNQKNINLHDEKTTEQEQTPIEPVKGVRLSAGINFEDLAAKAKSVGRLTTDFGNETCTV